MYNRTRAQALGYITSCEARLQEPMTLEGQYVCCEGHFHAVSWSHGLPTVSPWGFSPAFLAAIEQAENEGIDVAPPESRRYLRRYNEILIACGFGAVIIKPPSYDYD